MCTEVWRNVCVDVILMTSLFVSLLAAAHPSCALDSVSATCLHKRNGRVALM